MPGFDRSGPAGGGPMTGWGRGYCASRGSYGITRAWPSGSMGFGCGRSGLLQPDLHVCGKFYLTKLTNGITNTN
jgi:hypothetical protein